MNNIVKLKSNTKLHASRKVRTQKATDVHLIEACISYAQSMAAYKAAHKAAPDDAYADEAQAASLVRAKAALRSATKKATTATGLNAKARIVPVIIDDGSTGAGHYDFDPEQIEYLARFAADVREYLQPTVDDEWRAAKFGEVPL